MDVLRHFTPVQSYYKLAKTIEDDPKFDKKRAQRLLRYYVESNQYAIHEKANIMVEHFHTEVIAKGKVGGKARAMVITSSIKRAIEYYKAVPSASPVRPRVLAAVRPPQSSTWPPSGISILRRPASMCPSAPTAASCRTITSRWRWPWALTSACWAGISPGLTSLPPARSLWAAAI